MAIDPISAKLLMSAISSSGGGGKGGGGGGIAEGSSIAKSGAIAKGVGKTILGAVQAAKAKRIKPVRPVREVPKELEESAAMYRNMMGAESQADKTAREDIKTSMANQVGQAQRYSTSGSDVLNLLAGAQQSYDEASRKLAVQSEQRRLANMSAYEYAQAAVADEKQKNWDYNRKDKFDEDSAAKAALTSAAIQNIDAGTGEVIGAYAKGAGEGGKKKKKKIGAGSMGNVGAADRAGSTEIPEPMRNQL